MTRRLRLAVVTTHPIQYQAPLFRALARQSEVAARVFFTWSQSAGGALFDRGFGTTVTWDIPLLDGYEHEFVPNTAAKPGLEHFAGIRNPDLVDRIAAFKPDVVLVYGWNNASHLHAMRVLSRRWPVLFRGDSTLLDPIVGWRRFARRLSLRWIYRHVAGVAAVGQSNRDYFLWSGVPASRIWIAPHSVDNQRFAEDEAGHDAQAAAWRLELGIPADARVLLFAGKLQPKKAPELLLAALPASAKNVHLVFVGGGELEDSLRAQAVGRPDVHFLPFQNQRQMPAVYRLGNVFVLPSSGPGETWGLALNEAMACGRPVIASDRVGATRDLIREGWNGWTFIATDGADLQRKLQQALALDDTRLREMGRNARAHIASWSSEESARGIAAAAAGVLQYRDHRTV